MYEHYYNGRGLLPGAQRHGLPAAIPAFEAYDLFPFDVVLDELAWEYEQMTGDSCPAKLAVEIPDTGNGKVVRRFVNVMGASLIDGSFGSKTVYVDEERNTLSGDVLHYDSDGALLYQLPAEIVTPVRCGLMAALALRYRDLRDSCHLRDVVIVGAGELGVAIAQTLWALREQLEVGSLTVVTGKRRKLNLHRMPAGINVAMSEELRHLEGYSTLITATNHAGAPLEVEQLRQAPREIVSFDAGCFLGQSFRKNYFSFCDHPVQLSKNLTIDFPHDDKYLNQPIEFMRRTNRLESLARVEHSVRTATYLYGVATADLVVGRALDDFFSNKSRRASRLVLDSLVYN